jgi:uncharacterized membrane protein YvbJ
MEILVENIVVYASAILICLLVVILYLRRQKRRSRDTEAKIVPRLSRKGSLSRCLCIL